MIKISVNLSKLPKEKMTTSKNGEKWINLILWDNKDGVDKFGNTHSLTVSKAKEEKEQPNVYVGNGKDSSVPVAPVAPNAIGKSDSDDDDLPF
tara:strand:+ start:2466 stop:2744 length:279 start_codon:yes stop_codon:yes gene_type:complete